MSSNRWTSLMLGVYIDLINEYDKKLDKFVTVIPGVEKQVPIYDKYSGEQCGSETVTEDGKLVFSRSTKEVKTLGGSWNDQNHTTLTEHLEWVFGLDVDLHIVEGIIVGFAVGWHVKEDCTPEQLLKVAQQAIEFGLVCSTSPILWNLEHSE